MAANAAVEAVAGNQVVDLETGKRLALRVPEAEADPAGAVLEVIHLSIVSEALLISDARSQKRRELGLREVNKLGEGTLSNFSGFRPLKVVLTSDFLRWVEQLAHVPEVPKPAEVLHLRIDLTVHAQLAEDFHRAQVDEVRLREAGAR